MYSDEDILRECKDSWGNIIQKKYDNFFDKDGNRKKYISAREYLTWQFPQSMGKPLYFNQCQNMILLAGRGFGKSYIAGNIIAHEFIFDGVTDLDEYKLDLVNPSKEHPRTNSIMGAGDAKYSTGTLNKTWMSIDYLPGAMEINGRRYPSPFYPQTSGSLSTGKSLIAAYKKKVGGTWRTLGSRSTIKNRTFKDNPFAAQGERCSVMIYDEIGMFPKARDAYSACVDVMETDGNKFGSLLMVGTGGDFEGESGIDAKYMFYNPSDYKCLVFNDEWENRGNIGVFMPASKTNQKFKNDDGWTTVEAEQRAIEYYQKEREKLSGSKGDSLALDNFIVYHPLKPSEVFLSKSGNIFPVVELQKRLSTVESFDMVGLSQKVVNLYFDQETKYGVNYKINTKDKPINAFPYKGSNREGAVCIYEFPLTDDNGEVPEGLYIIGHDPIASDSETGESLASIYVLKTKKHPIQYGHDEIVASYIGRPFQGRDVVNETLLKLSMFYGEAKIYFENMVGNVKEYFEKQKKLRLLAKQPRTVLTKKASFDGAGPNIYGYPISNKAVKREALQYVRDWLLEERNSDGEIIVRNLDRIPDPGLLQELISFHWDGNFDRIMGFAGCIIGLQETHNQYENALSEQAKLDNVMNFLIKNKTLFKY